MLNSERSRVVLDQDEVARRVLQANFTTLRGKINITSVRCHLYENRAIDINVYDKLTQDTNMTVNDKNEYLLRYLISKGGEGYRQLVQALNQCGKEDAAQASLANDLEQWYNDEIKKDESLDVVTDSSLCAGQHCSDHSGRHSESSSVSSNMRIPSSISHQTTGQISNGSHQ